MIFSKLKYKGVAIVAALLSYLCSMTLSAQEVADAVKPVRPAASAFTVGIGEQRALDTYLTPIRYHGWEIALNYERMRAAGFAPESWLTRHDVSGEFAVLSNEAGNGSMLSAYLDYSFAMLRRWRIAEGLHLSLGGELGATLGSIYNRRNSNNPATAKAAIDLGVAAMLSYRLHIGKRPITLRYQASLPVVGAFFSPAFGESYYEMFGIGNHHDLVHMGFWHNRFDMRNNLLIDIHFGKRALRLGYRQLTRTTHINHIDTQVFSNMFVVGVSGEWFCPQPASRRIISVYE